MQCSASLNLVNARALKCCRVNGTYYSTMQYSYPRPADCHWLNSSRSISQLQQIILCPFNPLDSYRVHRCKKVTVVRVLPMRKVCIMVSQWGRFHVNALHILPGGRFNAFATLIGLICYRTVSAVCVHIISSAWVFTKQWNTLRFATIRSKSRDYKEGPLHSKKRKVLSSWYVMGAMFLASALNRSISSRY